MAKTSSPAPAADSNLPGYNFHGLQGFSPKRYTVLVNGPWCLTDEVRQKADAGGNWLRETHADIREESLRRVIAAAELLAEYDSEHRQVRHHSTEEVAGIKIIEALGALRLFSAGTVNLSALDNLNLTTAADINSTAGRDIKERMGNIAERIAKLKQVIKVESGGTIWLGNESDNLLKLLSELMGVVKAIAEGLATHKHPGVEPGGGKTQPPETDSTYTNAGNQAGTLKSKLDDMTE